MQHADVIVIGSGALGSATAFYLAERGARDVILVEKHDGAPPMDLTPMSPARFAARWQYRHSYGAA